MKPSLDELLGECDWGYCDLEAVDWRWHIEGACWLPVCLMHRQRRRSRAKT